MFRTLNSINSVCSVSHKCVFENPIILQSVRWRKRRWAPVNETKKFFVPVRPEFDPVESAELSLRTKLYNTKRKSLMKYFQDQVRAQKLQDVDQSVIDAERQAFQELLKENLKWNKETAKIREAREDVEKLRQEEEHLQALLAIDEQIQKKQNSAKRMVLLEQEAAKHFIDVNNLEEEIEKALDTRTNYNFAIDLEGNRYIGMPEQQISKTEDDLSTESVNVQS